MEFRILGPLEVIGDDGTSVAVGEPGRGVLALLLLSTNRVVPSERLAADLWGDHPPEGPRTPCGSTCPGCAALCARRAPRRSW